MYVCMSIHHVFTQTFIPHSLFEDIITKFMWNGFGYENMSIKNFGSHLEKNKQSVPVNGLCVS